MTDSNLKMIDPDELAYSLFTLHHLVETVKMMRNVIPDKDGLVFNAINTAESFLSKIGGQLSNARHPSACYVGTPEVRIDTHQGLVSLWLNESKLSEVHETDQRGVEILHDVAKSLSEVFGLTASKDGKMEVQDDLFDDPLFSVEPASKQESMTRFQ